MKTDLSVVLPAFNEAERITPTLRSYARWLDRQPLTYELLVVDDGSSDATVEVVNALRYELPHLRLLRCEQNRGKGHAVRVGMLDARGQVRVFTDADGSTGPDQLPKLLAPLLAGEARVAIGSRYAPGAQLAIPQPWYRRQWSRFANSIIQALLLPGLVDTQCGFKGLDADAAVQIFARCTVDGWSFDLELLAQARQLGMTIAEVPVRWTDDDRSTVKPGHLWRSIRELLRIRKKMQLAV